MTEYLRRLKTKLQFSHQDSKNDEPFFDANDVNWNTKVLTHSQWAHTILGSIIMGTILGYGQYYPVLMQMHYIFAIGLAIIVVGIFKALQSSERWHSLSKLIILVFVLVGLSYYQTDLRIINYNSYTSFYLQQEGEYFGTVVSYPELVTIDKQEYYKYNVELHGLHPYKDTAKNDYIKAQGRLQIYSKVSTTKYSIRLGDQAIIEGTPKSLFLIEEEGRINLRGRYMSSNTRGRIYDGVYRSATNKDLQAFHFKETFSEKLYGKSLYLCGQIRESIEKNIASNLDGPQKVLAQALCLGGHYSELGEERIKDFAYTGLIHILSISGSHIALLLALIYGLGRLVKLRKRTCLILGILVACTYCCIVGGEAPVIRATMMSILMCMAYVKGRLYQAKQALCICAILCLVYDPFSLFDVSFQLSFGATYGLLIWGKVLYERIQWLPKWIKTPLVLCVSAQLLILPLQLYYFHYISIASLLAACIVAPILDISIILIFISTVISYVMSISFLWSLVDALLRISLYLNHVLGRSGSLLWLGMMHLYCVYVYYTLLGLFTYFLTHKKEYTVYVVMSLLCMVATYGVSYYVTHHHKNTLIHYIPMKQCNVLLCIDPNHRGAYLLIDAPDYIKTIPNERLINQTIRAYGINPRMVKVKYFHSNGSARVIYKNGMNQIVVYNGQSREKNLKLNDEANVLFITSRFSVMHEIDRISPRSTVLFSSPHGALRDVDPSSEHMYIMGYSFIKDIYL
ncbi:MULTISPECIES: ComEC/Rec2 family competence protein [Veillonella]|uniref:ComEC/Rec2 family competence protein n=1 Tax=Veillonella TaxID=29465 RepID=UPI00257EF836|nr:MULTISPECIES: ComEC/Rec2 family competence protein [Veillonella]MBS5067716.1 ComEC/Rec2 family competence protein [Veillonella sp.]MDU1160745.1 ComEC/Rec2 family competence protein [Veillonella parvula]MDU1166414.1 ComEC/Rec2 family competence protein [Veillonella parvula]MDU1826790.1 ComEC/Rec2 family competence protein [Veillonella sp.]MDU4006520.1 ComEC/Rec2 family competence protein [Veillonella sp.]